MPIKRRFHGFVILRSIFARILTIEQVAQIRQQNSRISVACLQTLYFFSLEIVEHGYESKIRGGFIASKGKGLRCLLSFFSRAWGLFSRSRIVEKKDPRGQAGISNILIATSYSFCHHRTMNAHICGRVLPFSREKVLQHYAINKLTCEDAIALAKYGSQASFWLWAPVRYKTGLKTPNYAYLLRVYRIHQNHIPGHSHIHNR